MNGTAAHAIVLECRADAFAVPSDALQTRWALRYDDNRLPARAAIVVTAAASEASRALAAELAEHLRSFIGSLCPDLTPSPSAGSCLDANPPSFLEEPLVRPLLVVVSDGITPFPPRAVLQSWLDRGARFAVVPVLPLTAQTRTWELLKDSVPELNALFFSKTTSECVEPITTIAGLGSDDRRIFISYRRTDTHDIAEQLFERLTKSRFEVFLDRFSVPPGVDFQQSLTDELSRKSMVLILESPRILDSTWVEHELNFAKQHELGRLAVALPGGQRVATLEDEYRIAVAPHELVRAHAAAEAGPVRRDDRLSGATIERIVDRVLIEHSTALARRRWTILESLMRALERAAPCDTRLDNDGALCVRKGAMAYRLWAAPRPPDVDEFRSAHRSMSANVGGSGSFIAATGFRSAARSDRQAWLAERSGVGVFGVGDLQRVVDSISKEASL